MIKRILLGLGGTQYTDVAIQRAVKLAKQFEAEITGVTVVDFKRLAKIGLVPKGAVHAAKEMAMQRVRLTKERIEEAISGFESACVADGIKHQVKQEGEKTPLI